MLPLASRPRPYWLKRLKSGSGYTLYRGGRAVGQMPEGDEDTVVLMNLTDALTRASESMSGLMQASGAASMRAAGQSLAERVAEE